MERCLEEGRSRLGEESKTLPLTPSEAKFNTTQKFQVFINPFFFLSSQRVSIIIHRYRIIGQYTNLHKVFNSVKYIRLNPGATVDTEKRTISISL